MYAMILRTLGPLHDNPEPLLYEELPDPAPASGEVLIRVSVCGVCHTELDEIEGRTQPPHLPVIPGHQVIGHIEALGSGVKDFKIGSRVGVAWIYSACGSCAYCKRGEENLCANFLATGRDVNGGYAELMTAPAAFVHMIPSVFTDAQAAPLLCAGSVGFRALRLSGLENGQNLGLTGFGASAHLVLQLVRHQYPDSNIFVFARAESERSFARKLGATWAGDTTDTAPQKLRAIIDTTPVWTPIVQALESLEPGGRLVINAIRKEEADKTALLKLDYASHLWLEKDIKSVANVTRADVHDFLELAAKIPLISAYQEYGLKDANLALHDMKTSDIRGAKVLRVA
jgi:propanol-preferring alcohol dehydrogenase